MHSIFLGLMEKILMGFWFGTSHHGFPYSIRTKVNCRMYTGHFIYTISTDCPSWWEADKHPSACWIQSPCEKSIRFNSLERYCNHIYHTTNFYFTINFIHMQTHEACEFTSWLLYYSLPVLHGILPDPYFTHYSLVVAAVHLLLSDTITEVMLNKVESSI